MPPPFRRYPASLPSLSHLSVAAQPLFRRYPDSIPSLRRLSVAEPPFRPATASFPSPHVLSVATGGQTRCCQPSKLGGTSGQTPTATRATRRLPELRSVERCDRGSDPPVTPSKARLATEGLTQCRATLNKAPNLHRSERSNPLPPFRPPTASLPSLHLPSVATLPP